MFVKFLMTGTLKAVSDQSPFTPPFAYSPKILIIYETMDIRNEAVIEALDF
ncbi:hypothetical protein [Bacillus sp. MUM 13]|uniref:hypothetical protein n=1 Tax=Bacillus sp. MUM 13 TaxID=1678001 RepID=UPI00147B7AC5|nr:hypothetical protein [Bacillus sp. MUM 13]